LTADVDRIRSWRDQTVGVYDRESTPRDSDAVANVLGWWSDVDQLLDEIDRLGELVAEGQRVNDDLAADLATSEELRSDLEAGRPRRP
jgi:hypothetical protein